MKKVLLSLSLLVAVALIGGGCVFMSPEDREFYGKGWVKPTDLDSAPQHHKIPDPSRPETTTADATSTRSAPAATPDPEWLTPVPSTR